MRFIHFGCWNRGTCTPEGNNAISSVMRELKTYVETTKDKLDFMIIAGDNYYANKRTEIKIKDGVEKEKKIKTLYPDNLRSGFQCLQNIPLDKYLLLGNHELEETVDEVNGKINLDSNSNPIMPDTTDSRCVILKMQQRIANSLDSRITMFNNVLHHYDEASKTIIIMMDTTIYEIYAESIEPEEIAKAKEKGKAFTKGCYSETELGKSSGESIKELLDFQEAQITKILEDNKTKTNHIIMVGHHPIMGVKRKIKEKKLKDGTIKKTEEDVMETSVGLINFIKNSASARLGLFTDKSIHYLCADIHLYQQGQITIPLDDDNALLINQYIVGTGGAELDNLSTIKTAIYEDKANNNYNINYIANEDIKTNGFLVCDVTLDNIDCKFQEVKPVTQNAEAYTKPESTPAEATEAVTSSTATNQSAGTRRKIKYNKKTKNYHSRKKNNSKQNYKTTIHKMRNTKRKQ